MSGSDKSWIERVVARFFKQTPPPPEARVAAGDHSAAGGDGSVVVGGDVHGDVKIVQHPEVGRDPREARSEKARKRYLETLHRHCNVLPLAALGGEEGITDEVTLENVYIALDVRKPVSNSPLGGAVGRKGQGLEPEDTVAPALAAAAEINRLVLLGNPGSGKSTFVRQLAARLAAAHLGLGPPPMGFEPSLVPVFTVLRDLKPHLETLSFIGRAEEDQERDLADMLWRQWQSDLEKSGSGDFAEALRDQLVRGDVLIVFDGLDELPEKLRPAAGKAIRAVLQWYPAKRIIVTCRIRSYTGKTVVPGFLPYTLLPFDEEKIGAFTTAWYRAQASLGRVCGGAPDERAADLRKAAVGTELREMASNPMLLTTMAIIHQKEIGLPRERVRLFSTAIQVLLNRWQKRKGLDVSERLAGVLCDDSKLRTILERVAYEAHNQVKGKAADLTRGELLILMEQPNYMGDTSLAGEFLNYVDQRAGVLVGHGGDAEGNYPSSYSFPHRAFQEYLAGCYLVGSRAVGRMYWQRAEEGDYWSVAARLGAEDLLYNRRMESPLLDLIYDLCPVTEPQEEPQWRAALWSGIMAVLLGKEAIANDMLKPDGGRAYLDRVMVRLLRVLRESPLAAVERAEAGRVLAKLGDPRVEVLDPFQMQFMPVPADTGPFKMGEGAEYELNIPYEYKISRYPVTNSQFQAFVDADGYRNEKYWGEAKSEEIWENGVIRSRSRPQDFGEPYSLANHPVVGVTWYEALAFTRWLTEELRMMKKLSDAWELRLPSEAEWEKAARGTDGRTYPWGEEADRDRANYDETGIGATNAVGCFSRGATPYGVEDMSGNVWEWTRSLWGKHWGTPEFKYPYDAGDGRENLDASKEVCRVLRGGAFHYDALNVRCAARSRYSPYLGFRLFGFRVVASPISGL